MLTQPELLNAMSEAGAVPAGELPAPMLAEQIQRYRIEGDKPGSKNGWIMFFPDSEGAVFGSWKQGTKGSFFANGHTSLPAHEQLRRQAQARSMAAHVKQQRHREAASKSQKLWHLAQPAHSAHPYLQRKQVAPWGIRQLNEQLLIPVHNNDGMLISLQFIAEDGVKRFKSGGSMKSGRYAIGDPSISNTLLLCEGFATGATLHQATGHPVVVCFNAGNLLAVASDIRQRYRRHRLIICADNDSLTKNNPGLAAGRIAADRCRAELAYPVFDELDGSDFNDLARLNGLPAVAIVLEGNQA